MCLLLLDDLLDDWISHGAHVEDLGISSVVSVEWLDVWTSHVLVAHWTSPHFVDFDSSVEVTLHCGVGAMRSIIVFRNIFIQNFTSRLTSCRSSSI